MSDLDDDDEDFSMEAVQKWTRILFKKESKEKRYAKVEEQEECELNRTTTNSFNKFGKR